MIVRYYLQCEHCSRITAARIGIGHSQRQPFEFACGGCGTRISGEHLVDFEQVSASLVVKNARQLEPSQADYTVEIHPDFLVQAETLEGDILAGSPFVRWFGQAGPEHAVEHLAHIGWFERSVDEDWPQLERMAQFYLEGQLDRFQKEMAEFVPDDFPLDDPLEANRAFYQIFEVFFFPVLRGAEHVSNVHRMHQDVERLYRSRTEQFIQFCEYLDGSSVLRGLQKDLFRILQRFVERFSLFRPVVGADLLKRSSPDGLSGLAVTSVDFEALKVFYLDTFEVLSRALIILMGFVNIEDHSDFNFVSDSQYPRVRDLNAFANLPSGQKPRLIAKQGLAKLFVGPLDNRIRNGIGHANAHYDPRTRTVVYFPAREGAVHRKREEMGYLDFALNCYQAFLAAYEIWHLVKMLYVVKYLHARFGSA